MVAPGLLIILSPLVVGWLFGIQALAGLLLGSLLVATGLADGFFNLTLVLGGWDNAKKMLKNLLEQGFLGGKGNRRP